MTFIRLSVCVAAASFLGVAALAQDRVTNYRDACAVLKTQASKVIDQKFTGPVAKWSCDFIVSRYQPADYYVVGLHGAPCKSGDCGSNLIGWYAVRKQDGRVFYWNVADDVLADPL